MAAARERSAALALVRQEAATRTRSLHGHGATDRGRRRNGPLHAPRHAHGWTLVEVLAVSMIIAILSGYALAGYHRYLLRGYRLAAVMTLYRAAAYASQASAYVSGQGGDPDARVLPPPLARVPEFGRPVYRIAWRADAADRAAYVLEAEPEHGGPLEDDERCGIYVLDSAGRRANRIHGRLTTDSLTRCWPAG